jgi:hypothetical protein
MPLPALLISLATAAVGLAILAALRAAAFHLSGKDRVLSQGGRTIIANDHGGDQPPGRYPRQ